MGKHQSSAIGTLVERETRLIRLLHLPARDADALRIAITGTVSDLPVTLVRSITWDQGIEMAGHIDITADPGAPVYFCDSRSPWQRGSNEMPMVCYGNTSRKKPASTPTPQSTYAQSRTRSTTDLRASSETEAPLSFSPPC